MVRENSRTKLTKNAHIYYDDAQTIPVNKLEHEPASFYQNEKVQKIIYELIEKWSNNFPRTRC